MAGAFGVRDAAPPGVTWPRCTGFGCGWVKAREVVALPRGTTVAARSEKRMLAEPAVNGIWPRMTPAAPTWAPEVRITLLKRPPWKSPAATALMPFR